MSFNEPLESRCLFAAAAVDASTGTLFVQGGVKPEEIFVSIAPARSAGAVGAGSRIAGTASGSAAVAPASTPGIVVYDGNEVIFNSAMYRGRIEAIDVSGGGDDDVLRLSANGSALPVRLDGGDGKDTLYVTTNNSAAPEVLGGTGDDVVRASYTRGLDRAVTKEAIDGGTGNDDLSLRVSGMNFGGSVIGGDGNDLITLTANPTTKTATGVSASGGAGDDVIFGTILGDSLFGDAGDDHIFAGAGDDYLNGGVDNDELFGEDGNDMLDHGGGKDKLDGGAGTDTGIADSGDEVTSIEDLRQTKA